MSEMQKWIFAGALLNSALYLVCAFVAGIVLKNDIAWKLALATMGVCFLSWTAQYSISDKAPSYISLIGALAIASILLGAGAGIALLVG